MDEKPKESTIPEFVPLPRHLIKEPLTERTYRERITLYEIERNRKEEALRKRTDDMLRYMQEIDNHKLRGPSELDCMVFCENEFEAWELGGELGTLDIQLTSFMD